MSRLTNSDLISTSYSPWELCGLDEDCLRSCQDCHIAKMYRKLAAYEDIGFSPEELQQLVDRQKWHVVAEGDLPEEVNKTYQCTVLDKFEKEIILAEILYGTFVGFFCDTYLYDVLAWRELPEPWEGVNNERTI